MRPSSSYSTSSGWIGLSHKAQGWPVPGPPPHFRGHLVRQLSIRDAFTRDGPQFYFEFGQRHGSAQTIG
jgi:hypothetical protein